MPTETAKFALELEDGISSSSTSAEDALTSLQAQIDKDTRALAEMKKAMRQIQGGSSVDIAAYRKLKSEIDATQTSIGKARAAFVNLGGDFSKLGRKKPPKPPDVGKPKGLQDYLSAVDALPGPLSRASKGVGGLRSMIAGLTGALGVGGAVVLGVVALLVALAAALVAVTVATAKATAELLRYAAAQADAMRSERLRLEGMGTLRRWMRLTAKDAAGMSESISRVAERVPLERSQIAGLGEQLHRLGIRGNAAQDALEAFSLAQAVQGDVGRQRLMMLVRMAGHSEGAMRNLATRVRRELGGVAAMQMRSLGMLATRLRESLQQIAAGVNIEPLLAGLQRLSRLLSQETESGRALRAILSSLLGPLVDGIGEAAGPAEYFFKELVILALKVTIAIVRLRLWLERTFGEGFIGRMLRSETALNVFYGALVAVAAVVVTLAVATLVLGAVVAGLLAPLLLIGWALYRGGLAAYQFGQQLTILWQLVLRTLPNWNWMGQSMIDGLIAGLTSGATRLRDTVRGLASGAMGAFREALGIHSPSEAFARLGLAIPQGVAAGVERGSSEAAGAASGMVSTTTNNVSSVRGGPSRAVTVGELHVHVGGEGDRAEDTARRVADALRDFFDEGLAAEMP